MAHRWIHLATFVTVLLVAFPAVVSAQSKPAAFFVIGGGYGDTGNRNASDPMLSQPWKQPYGVSWPGRPAGRFSDGYVSTDFWADLFRVGNSPPPATLITNTTPVKYYKRGTTFAVAGSGIFSSFGLPTYGDQVEMLKELITAYPAVYSPYTLQRSICYVTYEGTDYVYQIVANNGSVTTITPAFMGSVVEGIAQTVRGLYILGLRNFLVSYAPPLGRSPLGAEFTAAVGISAADINAAVMQHNMLLENALGIVSILPDIHIATVDYYRAFNYVLDHPRGFGLNNATGPACMPTQVGAACGEVDAMGNPMYTLAPNPGTYFWFDTIYPTQTAWNVITQLAFTGVNFTGFTDNILVWFTLLNLTDVVPRDVGRVRQELTASLAAVNASGNYTELVEEWYGSGVDPIAPMIMAETFRVTVFLPTDTALNLALSPSNPVAAFLNEVPDVGYSLLAIHGVYGWWSAARLLALPSGSALESVQGTSIYIYNEVGGLYVGGNSTNGGVKVVAPDIYNSEYSVVLHGIDGALIPNFFKFLP